MHPRRFHRLRAVLEKRQPDLTVLLENVHKPHNFAAVVRSCDAVGVFEAHAVYPEGTSLPRGGHAAAGTRRWVKVRTHPSLAAAVGTLRDRRMTLVAADPSPEALDYRAVDYTRPTAIVLGQERDGLTAEALAACEVAVSIPMTGMTASLNVSVATALILFEAQRQRTEAGLYDRSRLEPELFERTLFEWAHPRIARRCRARGVPYPRLDDDGQPLDPFPR